MEVGESRPVLCSARFLRLNLYMFCRVGPSLHLRVPLQSRLLTGAQCSGCRSAGHCARAKSNGVLASMRGEARRCQSLSKCNVHMIASIHVLGNGRLEDAVVREDAAAP